MERINQIGVNTQHIGNALGSGKKAKPEEKELKEKEANNAEQQTPVSADKVLDFMAKSSIPVAQVQQKIVDPSKYVDEASAKRIAGFMADFEDKVAEGLKAFDSEFPGTEVSDSAKMAVVLAGINKEV